MKLLDLQLEVGRQLRSLPYDTYLKVIYALLEQYRVIYREALWPDAEALLRATTYLLRGGGDLEAEDVLARWLALEEDEPAGMDGGLLNLFHLGEFVSGELAGQYPHYAAVDAAELPISNHVAVHPLTLLDSAEWPGHPGAWLLRFLQDVAGLDDGKQTRIAAAPFDEAGQIIFG